LPAAHDRRDQRLVFLHSFQQDDNLCDVRAGFRGVRPAALDQLQVLLREAERVVCRRAQIDGRVADALGKVFSNDQRVVVASSV